MDYSLLKNKLYLILLAYYNEGKMPSFTKLGEKIGISRQTASTRFKELLKNGLITQDENDLIFVSNPLNIDLNKLKNYLDQNETINLLELKYYLFGTQENETKKDLAKQLGVSRSSLYLDEHSVVYAIQSEGRIKYIGTTQHFEDRIRQHIKKRPFLTPNNFLILVDNSNSQGYNIELELIHLLQTEWNVMGKNNN